MKKCKCIVVFPYNGKWRSCPIEMLTDIIIELANLNWNTRQTFGERCEDVARAIEKYPYCPKCGARIEIER